MEWIEISIDLKDIGMENLIQKTLDTQFHTSGLRKNPQFNFSSQNLSIECNFFQMRWKRNQDIMPTFP